MADPTKVRARAEAEFRKKAQAEDGKLAATEYKAESMAVRENMARLRALRLAKEAEDLANPPEPKAKPKAKAKVAKKADVK